jgi:hypothetical protein
LPKQPKEVKRPTIPMKFLEVLIDDGNPTHNEIGCVEVTIYFMM